MGEMESLVCKARSIRRFDASKPVDKEMLLTLVNLAHLAPNGNNAQVLRYHVTTDVHECGRIFEKLGWAARLKDWKGPEEAERPGGYIVILAPSPIAPIRLIDAGIAAQTMQLGACELGLGSCMLKSFPASLTEDLALQDDGLEAILVMAFGYPDEEIVLEQSSSPTDVAYWRDEQDIHHVPKLPLADVLV